MRRAGGADRLVVRPVMVFSNLHRRLLTRTSESRDTIRRYLEAIEVDESETWGGCPCAGNYEVVLFHEDVELVWIKVHDGSCVSWVAGAESGHAVLSSRSQRALRAWLRSLGYAPSSKGDLFSNPLSPGRDDERSAVLGHYPPGALWRFGALGDARAQAPPGGLDELGAAVARAFDDPVALAIATFRAYGEAKKPWSSPTPWQRVVLAAARRVSAGAFLEALEEVRPDLTAVRGAARLYFLEEFRRGLPTEAAEAWGDIFGGLILGDLDGQGKRRVLRVLNGVQNPQVDWLLLGLARPETVFPGRVPAPPRGDPSIRALAYEALVARGHWELGPEIRALANKNTHQPDRPVLERCLREIAARERREYDR